MAILSSSTVFTRARLLFALLLVSVEAACTGGCAHRVYTGATLPPEFLAPSVANVEAVDLSRLSHVAVSNELIDRGDVIDVTIVTDFDRLASTTTPVRVAEDGTANIPLVGAVPLAGMDLEDAEHGIASMAVHRGVFRNPHVTVTMRRQRKNRITVIGAVDAPGVYDLPRGGSSLLAALVAAGGLSEEAGADVEIRRGGLRSGAPQLIQPEVPRTAGPPAENDVAAQLAGYETSGTAPEIFHVSLVQTAKEGDRSQMISDGDVIVVAKRAPKPVFVMGLVKKPGEIELPSSQDLYVLDAIALAGGRTMQLADKVLVRRQVEGEMEPIVIELSVAKAKRNANENIRLAEGDIVSVEQTPVTVTMDVLRNFVRIAVGGSVALF